ncbi:MAG: sigma-54 dependent transcriptional regulator [Ferruginibacter sp.]
MNKILIIDDDMDMCLLLERFFRRNQFDVRITHSGKKGLEELERNPPDAILCDFRLGDTDGKELLIQIKQINPEVPVIIITGYSEIKMAVEVMKHGAFDYVTKPLFPEEILITIRNAIALTNDPAAIDTSFAGGNQMGRRSQGNQRKESKNAQYIFGDSREFKDILRQMDLVAPTNYSVIISGESGSGKEAIAQEIHSRSKRSNAPFIAIDCGALSRELAASELFGHEKGSFTGAANQKIGSLELANGGTVFLDEIANLSYDAQVSLLRVVQERKLRRVGGNKDIDLDIRIIVASNEQLWDAAKIGRFREDLYYRFNEFSINVPPLRERRDDILTFAHFFLDKSNMELEKQVRGFSPEVEHIFKYYKWPGNLRELKNVVKRSALLTDGDIIDVKALPFELVNHNRLTFESINEEDNKMPAGEATTWNTNSHLGSPQEAQMHSPAPEEYNKLSKYTLKTVSIDAEYEMILEALKKASFNKSKAAKLLNVDRKTLYNKMKQYNEFNEQ